MSTHTSLCKRIAWGYDAKPDDVDPGYECLELAEAMRRTGIGESDLEPASVINVIETSGDERFDGMAPVDVFEQLLREHQGA